MQNNTNSVVPVYKNGTLTWVPVVQNVQSPSSGQLVMSHRHMGHQMPQMIGTAAFTGRASTLRYANSTDNNLMMRANQDIVANAPQHIPMHNLKAATTHDRRAHNGAGSRAPLFGYGSEMQRHDAGFTGIIAAYDGAGRVRSPITATTMDSMNYQADVYFRSPAHSRHLSNHALMPINTATQSRSYNGGDYCTTIPCTEDTQRLPVTQIGTAGMSASNLRLAENVSDTRTSGISNHMRISVNRPHAPEGDTGLQLHVQRVQRPNMQTLHPCNRVLRSEQPHQLHMYDREASFAKSYIVNPSKSTSGQTQRYTPPNVHESVGMNVVAHGQGNARPPQNAHTGDVSVTDTMEIPTIKNTNTKWMTMQRLKGETTVAKRSDSQNIYNHISAVKSTGSHGFSNSVGSGMESPQKKYEADAQHESVTTMKTCVFYIDIKWKPVQPDQMLHFEFGISGDIYRQLFLFITNLLPPTGVRDIPSKSAFQACERYDSLMVMKDKLDISNDTMSDTNVLCMLEKLRTLKCAICKNGGRRKVLRKSYPERKCAIYSTSTKHELHCYFGSNIVDQKSRLLLYHKVICDREPVFICGKEDRNCKAVMERLYDLYLEIAEWRIQVVLRRLTNLRESTFQVSFGINARDMIDFIMFIFTN